MATSDDDTVYNAEWFFTQGVEALRANAEKRGIPVGKLLAEYAEDQPLRFMDFMSKIAPKDDPNANNFSSDFNPDGVSKVSDILDEMFGAGEASYVERVSED